MAMLHQGDAFALPFTVSSGGTTLTPSNCAGLTAALGTYTAEYGAGGIQWDSTGEPGHGRDERQLRRGRHAVSGAGGILRRLGAALGRCPRAGKREHHKEADKWRLN